MDKRGFLQVIVHSGRGLPPADVAILSKPTSDPYCVVSLGKQSHRTSTVDKDLNPAWEEHFNFRLASAGASFVQWASGASKNRRVLAPQYLDIVVYDEDTWKHHDLLGRYSLDLKPLLAEPNQWQKKEVTLIVAEGQKPGSHNTITVSVRWEPAPALNPYALRVLGFCCFAVAAAASFLAANCRWEPAGGSEGSVKQPGVGCAMVLASLSLLLATLIHLVLAHFSCGGLVNVLEQLEMGPVPKPPSDEGEAPHILKCYARPRKLAFYEVSVSPTIDLSGLRVPILLIAWALPVAGAALASLGIGLQISQAWTIHLQAGQVFATAVIASVCVGYCFIIRAEGDHSGLADSSSPSKWPSRSFMQRAVQLKKQEDASIAAASSNSDNLSMTSEASIRQRKRDGPARFFEKLRGQPEGEEN